MVRRGILRSHTNNIKPLLKEKHKIERLRFILKLVVPATVRQNARFDMLFNIIHIDEKWFFMSKITQRFYLLSEEQDPYRSCQSKAFITKVMFMGAVARPWLGENDEVLWDGKIRIFPFTEDVAAQRKSINRPKGTIETKAKQHITKEIIRQMMIEVLLPKIREKWPASACKTIWIQQDNARPHLLPTNIDFLQAASIDGFDIHLIQQLAQSPDLNILDLGFFKAIQSIQHQTFPDSVEKLIQSVQDAYESYDPKTLNRIWLHLMYVMNEVLNVKGGNEYKNPHVGKARLQRMGLLPKFVEVDDKLIEDTIALLNANIL